MSTGELAIYTELSTRSKVCGQVNQLDQDLPLEVRRDFFDLYPVFKSRNGEITTDMSNFIITYSPEYKSTNYMIKPSCKLCCQEWRMMA